MDRGGTFLGQIFLSPSPSPANGLPSGPVNPSKASFNLPLALLTNGLARVQPGLDASRLGPEGHLMMEAQKAAKEARLRVWEKWTPEMEMDATESSEGLEGEFDGLGLEGGSGAATSASRGGGGAKKGGEVLEVVVTEVAAPDEIFVQLVKEPRVAWLSEQLRAVGLTPDPIIPVSSFLPCYTTITNLGQRFKFINSKFGL